MTAIAGFVHDGHVWIGGDSAGVAGWDLTLRADQKVFRNGEFLIGFSGSFRSGQLLRYSFKPPTHKENQDIYEFMVVDFVDAMRACLKAGGLAKRENEVETTDNGWALIGYRGRLFCMCPDYQIGEALDPFDAIGCGSLICRGAMYAEADETIPEDRVLTALKAAEHMNAGVRGPFHIEKL